MPINLSARPRNIAPSQTLSISALETSMRAQGETVIGLSAGQPDYDTGDAIKAAGIAAIRHGKTKYTAVDGTLSLKQAIAAKMKRDNRLEYQADEIIVSCGAKHSIYNLCQALFEKGEEAIIPCPFWVSYPEIVKMAGGAPVICSAGREQNYKITARQLAAAITDKTRLLILNSPNNPTGAVYSKDELAELAQVLLEHPQLAILSDDIYEHLLFTDTPYANILNVCPQLADRTIIINGVSKAYAMTGWRIGYACAPAYVVAAMKKIQSQSTSNPSSISQAAAEFALTTPLDWVKEKRDLLKQRHDLANRLLNEIDGCSCLPAEGALYCFADFSEAISNKPSLQNDLVLAKHLLSEKKVSTIPGIAFGVANHLRVSFSCRSEHLQQGIAAIHEAIDEAS